MLITEDPQDGLGNLASLGQGRTAWAGLVLGVFLLSAGTFWLAAVIRQALSWRQLKGAGEVGGSAVSSSSGWPAGPRSAACSASRRSAPIPRLKYRLYEIDRLISRTLAYAIVTGLLVGVYAGLVLLSTHVLTVHGTVAVAASTLAAAALFTPLRRRVQHALDRRFNRARYDADQTVAAFATHLKDAVDLDSVRTDLTAVVHRALEPAHVSLWLTPRD